MRASTFIPMSDAPRKHSRKVEGARRTLQRRALSEWRGVYVPPDLRKFEKRLSDLVPAVMQKSGAAEIAGHIRIADEWESLTGAFIARHSRPVALRRGVLIVAVTQAAVRYDLERRHKESILERLRARFGQDVIRGLRFQNG
jgi:predicted nucleic acid-binding Zn ribbon protein